MSALKHPGTQGGAASVRPYPSWTAVADTVGLQQSWRAQDHQIRKEARIWRELAEEPRDDEADKPSGPTR